MTSIFEGRFPTDRPVWVWYGDGPSSVIPALVLDDSNLVATSPPSSDIGPRDIRIMFTTDSEHELVLPGGFSYLDTSTPPPGGAPGPVVGTPGGGSSGGGSSTGGPGSGGVVVAPPTSPTQPAPSPIGSNPAPSDPAPSNPPPSQPTPDPTPSPGDPSPDPGDPGTSPSPGPGQPPGDQPSAGSGNDGPPAITGRVGSANLRELRTGTPLHRLTTMVWPDRGCTSVCSATRL
ncbi:MAG: hypothetical protein AAGG08_03440 [Actinomycetota bacterium]